MSRERLDQVSAELAARDDLRDARAVFVDLRKAGFSVIESAYIVSKVFSMPLADAKRLIFEVESRADRQAYVEFHHQVIEEAEEQRE